MRSLSAVLCGFYGMGNLGDELLLKGMIDLFGSVGVEREDIAVLSGDPKATSREYGVRSVNRWSAGDIWRVCRSSKSLVLGGGGLFQDSTSVRSVSYYSGVMTLASMAGCSTWVYGNSLGPLSSLIGRSMARWALKRARSLALRDRSSMALATELGLRAVMCPDPVTSLSMDRASGDRLLVNLRPWDGRLELEAARSIAAYLSSRPTRAVGVAMASEDLELMEDFRRKGILPLEEIVLPDGNHPVWRLGAASIGMRLHFNVLSALSGIPGVAIPYDPKVRDFAASVGYGLLGPGGDIDPSGPDLIWLEGCRERAEKVFRSCWKEVSKC